jgi:hypothetical protein
MNPSHTLSKFYPARLPSAEDFSDVVSRPENSISRFQRDKDTNFMGTTKRARKKSIKKVKK